MEALKLFQEYMGTGLIMIWFLVSLLYLWVTEKRKHIRILFVYVPLVLLLVFFNPLVVKIISGLADGEIYYRILWLLPVTPVVAFTAVINFCSQSLWKAEGISEICGDNGRTDPVYAVRKPDLPQSLFSKSRECLSCTPECSGYL